MKPLFLLLLLSLSSTMSAKMPDASKILEEGKMLYALEKTSVVATSHFIKYFPGYADMANGYLSYINGDEITTIFYYKFDSTKILARYHFAASDPDHFTGVPETKRLVPSEIEDNLITIREKAVAKIKLNKDGYYTFYDGVAFTLLPVINTKERSVYVLSGSKMGDVIIMGNDYRLKFDKNNRYRGVERIHKSLIKLSTKAGMDTTQNATLHKHLISDAIDPTDICTLLLYRNQVEWDLHYVLSEKYVSVFDLTTRKLVIVKTKDWKKIGSDALKDE